MFRPFRYWNFGSVAMAATLPLLVALALLVTSPDRAWAGTAQHIERGTQATAESLNPEAERPSSFEAFATETLRRLKDGASRLQTKADKAARSFSSSVTDSATEMDGMWADTVEKFRTLQDQVDDTYESLERRTVRAIEQFQSWLAGDQTRPRPAPRPAPYSVPQPPMPGQIEGEGPGIRV